MTSKDLEPLAFVDLKAQYAQLKSRIDANIATVLDHGKFILGPEVAEFEHALSGFTGSKHVITVASGTDALQIALLAEGIGPGDAVFLPAFTFTATAGVVVQCGAEPVFCDITASDFAIDIESLTHQIEKVEDEGRLRPRAVIAVDLFGLPADYNGLHRLANEKDLFLLADAAQSFGATYHNRKVGTLAPATATSFFPAKPLGCYGDGGALFCDDDARAALIRSIRSHGQGSAKYDVARFGCNSRLDTLQAAILIAKLEVFEDELVRRREVAEQYDRALAETSLVRPERFASKISAWAQYTVLLNDRDKVAADLKQVGVPTAIYYPKPMHEQPAYKQFSEGVGSLPVSEELSKRVLSLPFHPYMDEGAISRTVDALICASSTR